MARKIHQPHDKFMKSLMGDIDIAREYFGAFLPESVKKVVDLSGLEHSPNSFVSEKLKETQADMVFKCPLVGSYGDQKVYLCLIIVEHKSTPYKYTAIQMGGYMFDAYRKQVDDKEDPLMVVLPFLYYHGSDEWTPPGMHDIFELTPSFLKAYIPFFQLIFENIQNYSDEQIRKLGGGLFTSAVLTQKYADRPEMLLDRFRQIFSILGSWEGRNLFAALIVYFIELVEVEEEELKLLVDQIPEVMKTEFVSLADRLRESGMKKGRDQKNWAATENMLRKGMDDSFICDVLDVTPAFVEKVRNATIDQDH